MGKILLFASFAITLATAGIGFINKGKLDEAKAKAQESDSASSQLRATVAKDANELKAAKDALATASSEKDAAVAQTASVQADLDKAKSQVNDLTSAKSTSDAAVTQAQADLAAAKQELETLKANQSATPAGPSDDVKAQLEEQKTIIAKLQSDLDTARKQAEDLNRANQARLSKTMQKGLQGKILAVNPAWNFVVLSLGDKNGVVNNAEMLVKRGSQLIGKVRITSVEPSTSIADIVANSMPQGATISPGDQVIYQNVEE